MKKKIIKQVDYLHFGVWVSYLFFVYFIIHPPLQYVSWHETRSDNKINVKELESSSVPNFFGSVSLCR